MTSIVLVDPETKSVETKQIEQADLLQVAKEYVGTDDIDFGMLFRDQDAYRGDEVIVAGDNLLGKTAHVWFVKDYIHPLGGRGVIFGFNETGDTVDPHRNAFWYADNIKFVGKRKIGIETEHSPGLSVTYTTIDGKKRGEHLR